MKNYPSISVILPVLNAERVIEKCLKSIKKQKYPKSKIEVIIADGGSIDNTVKIAKEYGAKIYPNLLKTAESGKAVALGKAKNELVLSIDSDNYLPKNNWLMRMVEPFDEADILGSEPWEYTYRKNDSLVNRYCALIGANDPYCFFVGNYDKISAISGKWTGINLEQTDMGNYLKVRIAKGLVPTIGANGVIWRKKILEKAAGNTGYLFDTDIPYVIAKEGSFFFAKVKVGIIHDYCSKMSDFYRKQKRRAKDFFYMESQKKRPTTFQKQSCKRLYFVFSTILIFPLVFQAFKGYLKKPDKVWLLHPWFCITTLWIYGTETILAKFKTSEMSREGWKQ